MSLEPMPLNPLATPELGGFDSTWHCAEVRDSTWQPGDPANFVLVRKRSGDAVLIDQDDREYVKESTYLVRA